MYHFVEDKEFINETRRFCSDVVCKVRDYLHKEGINSQPILVGSGARNLITQNANELIDFDYNLEILDCDDFDDCKTIKEAVKKCFNKVLRENKLRDCDDSTSVLTSKTIIDDRWPNLGFNIDLCITYEDGDQWYRLIHEKTRQNWYVQDRWYWNQGFTKHKYAEKAKQIKTIPGTWEKVRNKYLTKKNKYLQLGDNNHPSFICYVEAVNDTYNELRQKKLIKK